MTDDTDRQKIIELERLLSQKNQELQEKEQQLFEAFQNHVHFSSFQKLKELTDEKIENLNTIIHHGVTITEVHSVPEILSIFLESVVNLMRLDKVAVFFKKKEQKVQVLRIVAGRGISLEAQNRFRLKSGTGLAGWAFEQNLPDLVYDVTNDERYIVRKGHRTRRETVLVVPIRIDTVVLGVVCAEKAYPSDRLLTRNDLDYLSILTNFAAAALKNARMYQKLQHRLHETFTLMEVSEAITSTLNLDRVLNLILQNISKIIGVQRCSIMLLNKTKTHLNIRATLGFRKGDRTSAIPVGDGIAGRVAKTGEPLLIQDIDTHATFKRTKNEEYISKSLLSVPLRTKGQLIGVLNITNKRDEKAFTEVEQRLVSYYADQVAIAIENANLYTQVEKLATTDALTGLANHRFFQDVLAESFASATKNGLPLALIMIDVDNFKRLNDTHGHLAGDSVLREIGAIILAAQSSRDFLPARYGGEEFAIILPGFSVDDGFALAEELRTKVMEHTVVGPSGDILTETMSCGISTLTDDVRGPQDLIDRADKAMYLAKRSGKNRTVIFT